MNHLQPFVYEGNNLRTEVKNGEPWFVMQDVCKILGIGNVSMASERLDPDEQGIISTDTPGGAQKLLAVNEPGLYSLILGSRKPEAKAFKRWITHEVVPTIRRTGGYYLPTNLPDALRLAADLAEENEMLKPKAEAHDLFLAANNAQPMKIVADAIGVGRNTLFKLLREKKILTSDNVPYRRYLDRGYFKVIEKTIEMGGQVINKPQTLVTPKGVDYIGRMVGQKSA